MPKGIEILTAGEVRRVIQRLAFEVLERHGECKDFVIIGIYRRGVYLAQRLKAILEEQVKNSIVLGKLDINFYRDDWTSLKSHPIINESEIPADINGKSLLLVDDVIYTGRTIRAALDALLDFGRPSRVELLVFVDRGHRELPIHPDYVGKKVNTSRREQVDVLLKEIDGKDGVILYQPS